MLHSIKLGNFKAFSRTQNIPIKPITLIYGANSAGKSSVLHGLLLAREGLDTGNFDVHQTELGGPSVDLGGFRQYIYKRRGNRAVSLAFTQRFSSEPRSDQDEWMVIIEISAQGTYREDIDIAKYELLHNGKRLAQFTGSEVEYLDIRDTYFRDKLAAVLGEMLGSEERMDSAEIDEEELLDMLLEILEVKVMRGTVRTNGLQPSIRYEPVIADKDAYWRMPWSTSAEMLRKIYFDDHPQSDRQFEYLIETFVNEVYDATLQEVSGNLKKTLRKLHYLGPLRSIPDRHFSHSNRQDPNWFAGGSDAWFQLLRNEKLRDQVNAWLNSDFIKSRYKIVVRDFVDRNEFFKRMDVTSKSQKEIDDAFEKNASGELGDEEFFEAYDDAYSEYERHWREIKNMSEMSVLSMHDEQIDTYVSHRDVGFGISQVLPIIVNAYGFDEKILAIEQPEIHLHPALQAELADVFIDTSLGSQGNVYVLETHSEHLLLRIMRRMRETYEGRLPEGCLPVTPEDISVLYVEPEKDGSVVLEMPLNERGDLIKPWPGGFFEESFTEVFS